MGVQTISLCLNMLGITGTIALLIATGLVIWYYRGSRRGSFRWRWRNWRLKQLSALACLFFLAMAASYGVLNEAWGWLYIIGAFRTGTWWLRRAFNQGL
jgi:hypothetical protein